MAVLAVCCWRNVHTCRNVKTNLGHLTPANTYVSELWRSNVGTGQAGTAFSMTCPGTSFIRKFNGRGGDWVDAIGAFECSDGTALDPVGGSGGGSFADNSYDSYYGTTDGYMKICVQSGSDFIRSLTLYRYPTGSTAVLGGYGSVSRIDDLVCPDNTRIAGVSGYADSNRVYQLGILCRGDPLGQVGVNCFGHG